MTHVQDISAYNILNVSQDNIITVNTQTVGAMKYFVQQVFPGQI